MGGLSPGISFISFNVTVSGLKVKRGWFFLSNVSRGFSFHGLFEETGGLPWGFLFMVYLKGWVSGLLFLRVFSFHNYGLFEEQG